MKASYEDIRKRIPEEPSWYDQNGVPRYGDFIPKNNHNIYSQQVALLLIACQDCRQEFKVAMCAGIWDQKEFVPRNLHYGDPPRHDCVGDTMNCDDLAVLEVWAKEDDGWTRHPEMEGIIQQ